MVNEIFHTLLLLSISGSIVTLVLFALKPLIHNRFNKTWQFYIWLVVVARLLIPYVPPISIVEEVAKFAKQYGVSIEIPINIESGSPLQNDINANDIIQNEPINIINNEVVNQKINTEPNANISKSSSLYVEQELFKLLHKALPYIGIIWLTIFILLFARKITSYYGFIRFLKKGSIVITDDTILEHYQDICQSMGIKNTPYLYSNSVVLSPMCIGFFRQYIILPDKQLDNLNFLQYIFRHELTHYKRLDIYYKWLVQFVICIHWFNPIVYFIGKEVNKYCELSCDETVIKKLNTVEQKAYGDTLLRSLELGGYFSNNAVSLTLTENTKFMKERLNAIMKFHTKSKLTLCLSTFLTIFLSTGAMFTAVYAKSEPIQGDFSSIPLSTQINAQNDKLIEKEYSKSDLKTMNVSGIILDIPSENVSITRGGETLKLKYYQSSDNDYALDTQQDMGGKINELSLKSLNPSQSIETPRTIFVTIPDDVNFEVIHVQTQSGNITIDKCKSNILNVETQKGQVLVNSGIVNQMILAKSISGNINITGLSIPKKNYLESETGTITLQLLDSAKNYKLNVDTDTEAKIVVNDRKYKGGDYTINDSASNNIYFDSKNGSLVIKDSVK